MAREVIHRATIIQTEFEIVEDGPNGRYVAEVKRGQEEVRIFSEQEFSRVFHVFDDARESLLAEPEAAPPSPNGREKSARKPRGKSYAAKDAEEPAQVN